MPHQEAFGVVGCVYRVECLAITSLLLAPRLHISNESSYQAILWQCLVTGKRH